MKPWMAISLLCIAPNAVMAHEFPAQRTVVVQTEESRAGVMVTWQSDVGPRADSYAIASMWPSSKRASRLQAGVLRRAMAGVQVRKNGTLVDSSRMRMKMVTQPPMGSQRRRYGIVILLEIPAGP
ncbi:MAG: hypothetical protein KDA60_20965, partial [Planctomycetales bacterium]|nr:hypothetical protein [Planctomycetales bacterium]